VGRNRTVSIKSFGNGEKKPETRKKLKALAAPATKPNDGNLRMFEGKNQEGKDMHGKISGRKDIDVRRRSFGGKKTKVQA